MRRYAWVALLYVAQGLPFGLVNMAMPIAFTEFGVDLRSIGLLSLAGLPWTFKFLWAPLVDRFGRRWAWVTACMGGIAAFVLGFGLAFRGEVTPAIWAIVVGIAILSATQDVAIDAGTIEFLRPHELGLGNGVRVTAYRVALIVSASLVPVLAARTGWAGAWAAMGGAALLLGLAAFFAPPTPPHPRAPRPAREVVGGVARGVGLPLVFAALAYAGGGAVEISADVRTTIAVLVGLGAAIWIAFARPSGATGGDEDDALRRLLARPGAVPVALFLLTFKLGDLAMAPMTTPFLKRGAGLTAEEIGVLLGTFGVGANIAGALLGGALTTRWGIFRALWVLGLLQAVSNLGYAAAAVVPDPNAARAAAVFEAFCGGLGTAPFLAFMMSICEKERAATQYAFLSAVYGLCRALAGAASGYLAEPMGYGPYFVATFVMALPAFALLPWARRWIPAA